MEALNNVDETAKDLAEFLRSVTNRIRIAKRGFSVGHLIVGSAHSYRLIKLLIYGHTVPHTVEAG